MLQQMFIALLNQQITLSKVFDKYHGDSCIYLNLRVYKENVLGAYSQHFILFIT